jgi:hypothetical protein
VRTTLTLDDDVAVRLRAETRRTGKSFRETVNENLRRGLLSRRPSGARNPFRIRPRDLGGLLPGLSLDNVSDLLERIEDPGHR